MREVNKKSAKKKMRNLKRKLMDPMRKAKEPSSSTSKRHDKKCSELLTLISGNDVELAVEKPKKSIKPKEDKQVMIHERFEDAFVARKLHLKPWEPSSSKVEEEEDSGEESSEKEENDEGSSEEDESSGEEESSEKEEDDEAATTETKQEEDNGYESSEEVEDEGSYEEEATTKQQPPSKVEKAKEKEICVSGKAQKRVSEGTSEDMNAAKKVKTEEKRMVPQRIWSEQDELVLLQGMMDFESQTRKKANADRKGFYEFIKESITFEVTYSQCISKIDTLKKKYKNNAEKGKKPSSSKPLALKAFELSEKIWGNRSGTEAAEDSRRSERIKKLEEEGKAVMNLEQEGDWFSNSVLARQFLSLGMDDDCLKRRWSLVDTKKKKMVEDKWNVVQTKELELVSQKAKLLYEVGSLFV